jgi:mannose-6-phosphate isomerase-like protein (cupin superfamily)
MLLQKLERESCQHESGILIQKLDLSYPSIQAPFKSMWCVVEPSSSSAPDQHGQAEMVVIVEGKALVDIDGTVVEATPGTVVHLPPDSRHVVHNPSPDQPLSLLSIYWFIHDQSVAAEGM